MSLIFFGTPGFSVPSLKAVMHADQPLSLVVTQPDKKGGGKKKVAPPPVKTAALEHGYRVLQPENLKDNAFLRELKTLSPEFIIVVAYGKILPKEVLAIPRKGCINLHASLLPAYRGAAPIQWAIIHGEKTTGITTMLMDGGLDTGNILLQKEVIIERDDNAKTLSDKLSKIGAGLLIDTLDGVRKGGILPRPQTGDHSYAPMLKKEDGRIDWNKDAEALFSFIRGMYPWPCAFTFFNGKYIKILESEPVAGSGTPGRIESAGGNGIYIGTGNGLLSLKSLQPEGKKPLDARSFINGYRLKEGDSFA